MKGSTSRDDKGNVFLIAVGITALIAVAVVLIARTHKVRIDASIKETLAVELRFAGRTSEAILDAWMAAPNHSQVITALGATEGREWMSPFGDTPCPDPLADPPLTVCWRIRADDPSTPTNEDGITDVDFDDPSTPTIDESILRGGEAERNSKEILVEIIAGCYTSDPADCQRNTSLTRRYEQSVTFQYQLHYDTNHVPLAAIYGSDKTPDDIRCVTDPTYTGVCDDPTATYGPDLLPDDPRCVTDPTYTGVCDGYDERTVIVFTNEDKLNGPLRYSGSGSVMYCGSPEFYRVEVSGIAPDPDNDTIPDDIDDDDGDLIPNVNDTDYSVFPIDIADPGCPNTPEWKDKNGNPNPNRDIIYGGDLLELPEVDATSFSATLQCDVIDFDFRLPLANCSQVIADGHLMAPTSGVSDITIYELILDGSATVYASGDIIICGDIEASGLNPAGGPNVIALVAEGDVVLDPSGQPSICGKDVVPTLTELSSSHDMSLTNVAVLAPNGAIYARNWHLRHHSSGGPTLSLDGSVAAKHLGLYGIPTAAGAVTNGWAKNFTYPTDFWQARPSWWPGFSGSEWEPIGEVGSGAEVIYQEVDALPTSITVTEGSSTQASLRVNLTTQPSENVTVAITGSMVGSGLTVVPQTLTFTTSNWHSPKTVLVDAASHDDADRNDGFTTLSLAATGGDYTGLSTDVAVTITDNDVPGLLMPRDTVIVSEGATADFDVRLATQPSATVTVNVVSADLTAATVTPPTLTFSTTDWDTDQTVTIRGEDDTDQTNENTIVTLTAHNGGYDAISDTIDVSVADDDAPPLTVSISDTSAVEGSPLIFTVTLSSVHTQPVTVTWGSGRMSDTAYAYVDYTLPNPVPPVTIIAGSTSATFNIPTIDNTQPNSDKIMTVELLTANSGVTLGTSTAQGTITDDDVIEMLIAPDAIVIPDDSGHAGSFAVSLSSAPAVDVTVSITSSPAQLVMNSATLTFTTSDWDTPQQVRVNDGYSSGEPQTTLTLDAGGGSTDEVLVYIVDNEDANAEHPILGLPLITDWSAPGRARNVRLTCDIPNGAATITWARPVLHARTEAGYEVSGSDSGGTSVSAITRRETAERRLELDFAPQGTLTLTVTGFNFNRDNLARQDSNPLTVDLTC